MVKGMVVQVEDERYGEGGGGGVVVWGVLFFFFNDTATTEIYTLSLHDALPISERRTDRSLRGRNLRAGEFLQSELYRA